MIDTTKPHERPIFVATLRVQGIAKGERRVKSHRSYLGQAEIGNDSEMLDLQKKGIEAVKSFRAVEAADVKFEVATLKHFADGEPDMILRGVGSGARDITIDLR
ncbi:hypothetical protein UFOVP75_29 [uncultured Caudovirales phage]|uniref:Uncharacterized protein n=1 Tax=uncultured Caudovirales phage TaxID=2100421 RepID=A0A6J5L0I4_9CAUD|nr:hypothetical protein UFOVP75_29 [uncultured Caudovirales phage]